MDFQSGEKTGARQVTSVGERREKRERERERIEEDQQRQTDTRERA